MDADSTAAAPANISTSISISSRTMTTIPQPQAQIDAQACLSGYLLADTAVRNNHTSWWHEKDLVIPQKQRSPVAVECHRHCLTSAKMSSMVPFVYSSTHALAPQSNMLAARMPCGRQGQVRISHAGHLVVLPIVCLLVSLGSKHNLTCHKLMAVLSRAVPCHSLMSTVQISAVQYSTMQQGRLVLV